MSSSLGLRERKKAATRAAIADAARRLSLSRGFDAVTIEAIAEEAGVSPRTVFNYFPSKEAAVLAPSARRWERVTALLTDRPAEEDGWTALRRALVEVHGAASDTDDWMDAVLLARSNPALLAQQRNDYIQVERLLADQVARRMGADTEDLRPQLVVATAVAALRIAVQRWLDEPEGPDLAVLLDRTLDVVAKGMGPAAPDEGGS